MTTPPLPRGDEPTGLPPSDSWWRIWYDLAWGHALVWLVSFGQPVTPNRGVQLFFSDRYGNLAVFHERRGHTTKAECYWSRALAYWQAAGPDPDAPLPPAMAAAMPRPRPRQFRDARATEHPTSASPQ